MTWNHRVIRRKYENGEEYFAIHEVYYNKDGKPNMVTTLPITIVEESVDDLAITIDLIRKCLDKPVLDYDKDFPDV